ncbi:ankyrin [Penicillium odoratum]|uniref:ankyrin n=1 Tax=Penicillium odoratum TaxID=1167516 RepID=UPI0025476CBD|nr:ankyrin [Penicillium odoratum]KAJ5745316.1 ankyrin [Penicillium odoratum]
MYASPAIQYILLEILIIPSWIYTAPKHLKKTSLGDIPCELLLIIAKFCDTQSFARLTQTCKTIHITLTPTKTHRGKEEALLPAESYLERCIYNKGAGIHPPARFSTKWPSTARIRRGFNNEGRLVRAVQKGKIHGFKALLDLGVDPNAYDYTGVWVLDIAVYKQDLEMVDLLLRHGAIPDVTDLHHRKYVLNYAAWDDPITQRLILAGADLNLGFLMHNIVSRNSIQTISMALGYWKRGQHLEGEHDDRRPSLRHSAVRRGDPDVLRLLFSRPESYVMSNDVALFQGSALHMAIKARETELAWMLIEAGIDLDVVGNDSSTALHWALKEELLDVARGLVEAGCELNHVTAEGKTELHIAVEVGSVELVRLLLQKGVLVDLRRNNVVFRGRLTFLHHAIQGRRRDIVQAILSEGSHGPDLTIENDVGITP